MSEEVFDQPTHSEKARRRQERKAVKEAKAKPAAPLQAKTAKQADLLNVINTFPVFLAIGPAGTGKTYIPTRRAVEFLMSPKSPSERIERIIISRPTASAPRHRLGFQPGGANAKMKPWMVPIMDSIKKGGISGAIADKMLADGRIEIVPFEFMRGRTFDNAFVIVDEAQNCTFEDLEMVVTRTGENCRVAIVGDPGQTDLEAQSGLMNFVEMVRHYNMNVGLVEFDENDVVRSAVASEFVKAIKMWKAKQRMDEGTMAAGVSFLNNEVHRRQRVRI
jgi:phosphate starvation-inducible PhoH-like protein